VSELAADWPQIFIPVQHSSNAGQFKVLQESDCLGTIVVGFSYLKKKRQQLAYRYDYACEWWTMNRCDTLQRYWWLA
jgi:hypothetical protein